MIHVVALTDRSDHRLVDCHCRPRAPFRELDSGDKILVHTARLSDRPDVADCTCDRCRFDRLYDQHLEQLLAKPRDEAAIALTRAELGAAGLVIDGAPK
jgi:hypothetical protein